MLISKPVAIQLYNAYHELWQCVENGTIDDSVFLLREKYRNLVDSIRIETE